MPVISEFLLDGKLALLAGDDGGFVPHLAQVLAEAGAQVRIASSNPQLAEQALAGARTLDPTARAVAADLGSEEGVATAIAELLGPDTPADILVNSFRTDYAQPFEQVSQQELAQVFQRNVTPVALLCRTLGSLMASRGAGRIVNIISNLAERGMINSAAFCASQGAVLQLTRALALEWGAQGVRVNAIGIGWFSAVDEVPEEAQRELLVRYIPLRRRGHPRDIGPLLAYLASDACDYTTGQPIYIDGGLMAHP